MAPYAVPARIVLPSPAAPPMKPLMKTPLVVAVKATYWVPVGLIVLPAIDALRVVHDSLAVVVRHALPPRRR
ncbi:MAG: hypothetical protein ABI696_16030 [Rubrivivax sp.]